MSTFKYAFLGCTNYSAQLLEFLIFKGYRPSAIFSIPRKFGISYSEELVTNTNFSDLSTYAEELEIPYFEVESGRGKTLPEYSKEISTMDLDLLLVLGWYYMILRKIRQLTRYGAWGIHASKLPKYAGGAPLNWAMINGESETGVTLFRMEDGVDNGDIISQKVFPIDYEDTIADVYQKATEKSKEILLECFSNPLNVSFTAQDEKKIEVYPQRSAKDGELDLSMSSLDMYNFIRAQAPPYPGAYIRTTDGKKLIIEKCRVEDL
ncbi:formyltransferase family protein [Vibrio sp.]|uniref:methionyl-tRNA formyltransferase n=1 Tax=Vibrio sp. TaxID=678 RepID=UPI00311FE7FA